MYFCVYLRQPYEPKIPASRYASHVFPELLGPTRIVSGLRSNSAFCNGPKFRTCIFMVLFHPVLPLYFFLLISITDRQGYTDVVLICIIAYLLVNLFWCRKIEYIAKCIIT